MAIVIPDSIPAKASQGEERLYRILRDRLPDDFCVWYEPDVNGSYPDFIILAPSFGLLILEVKGWYAGSIEDANSNYFRVRRRGDGGEESVQSHLSPLRQGHQYYGSVADKLKEYAILTHASGNLQGKLTFPIGVGAVMSNITTAQAHAENLYTLLPHPQVAYREELNHWESISTEALLDRLKAMFRVNFAFPPLTEAQLGTIKGVLYPERVVSPLDASVLVYMDLAQERLAAELREGHRLFCGVAGSGKTVILLARARYLANRLQGQRVLILCFNLTLAAYLRSILHEDSKNPHYRERIEVCHFHGWAHSLLGYLPNPDHVQDYDQFLGKQLQKAISQLRVEEKWDSILVDEAHTFAPDWFKCCVAALKDPENGDLMIVSDANQRLYKRQPFTWSSVGIKAKGRTKKLSQNYRNTQQILSAAWDTLKPAMAGVEEDTTFTLVEPNTALRDGPVPVLHLAPSRAKALTAAVSKIERLCEGGYAPKDIAVLYRYKRQQDSALFETLRRQLDERGLSCYWVTENRKSKETYSARRGGVRLVAALSSLGLEFKVVLILWVEQFGDRYSVEAEQATLARRQLYVAMTRAQESLYLFGSGQVPLLEELEQSQGFEVVLKG